MELSLNRTRANLSNKEGKEAKDNSTTRQVMYLILLSLKVISEITDQLRPSHPIKQISI
jgi:hypothetical protein